MVRPFISFTLSFLLAFIDFIPPRLSHAQEIKEYTIAVLNFEAKGVSLVEADVISERLRTQVSQTLSSGKYRDSDKDQYKVIESTQMDKIFDQFEIQNTGCVSDSCAVEFGKMLGVERIIIGSIGLVGDTYSVSARIVDVETAETISVADHLYPGSIDNFIKNEISKVSDKLLFGMVMKSYKKLYIIAAATIVVGIAAYFLFQPPEDDEMTISIEVPIPQD
ncbi:MAG: hypothetical protein GH151_11170 [Bacteroidetes bacterium]|nr:hypothetical protein [Bacteroidota bacterium]